MPAPLIWLGLGLAATYAGTQYARQQQIDSGDLRHFPGDSSIKVKPKNGSIVCCGIYEVFQHTGIWVDDSIIELRGNGLVRSVSPARFLSDRSGERVYVACDDNYAPLCADHIAERALENVFTYLDYDVIKNNCNRFTHYCLTGQWADITRFAELNQAIRQHYQSSISWQPITI